jgi:hypothetical protein
MAIDINIPSQVKNYANLAGFPVTGSLKTIYIAEDTNKTYRWTGSAYVEISASQAASWGTITGTLSSQTDLQTALNAKQDSLGFTPVPTSRTLTINGTTQDLSADRTFTISTGITIGTTAITSGTVGRVLFEGTGNVVSESANLFWDNTNGRLGIGTSSPSASIHSSGSANSAFGSLFQNTSTGVQASTSVNVANNSATIGGISTYSSANNTAYLRSNVILASYPAASNVIIATNFDVASGGTGQIQFKLGGYGGSINSTIFSTGNWGINTTTDAGFKLDVNGTARFNGNLTFQTTNWILDNSNAIIHRGGFGVESIAFNLSRMVFTDNNGFVFNGSNSGATLTASSIVDIQSTTKGFLPPRLTTTQKNAIASPAEGLQVWDTTLKLMSVYNGTTWITL